MTTFLLTTGVVVAIYLIVSSWWVGRTGQYMAAALRAFLGAALAFVVCFTVLYMKAKGLIE